MHTDFQGRISVDVDFASRRTTPTKGIGIFVFVVLLHAMIVYALATGMVLRQAPVSPRPIEVRIIKEIVETAPMPEATPPPSRPRPPKPVLKPTPKPRPSTPAPNVRVRQPAPLPPAPAAVTSTAPAPAPPAPVSEPEPAPQAPVASIDPAPAPRASVRTAPVVDSRFCNKPEYPSVSRRFEETGTVVLNFLIDADGRVVQSRIESSSGYQRLDEAARQALSLCRFKPGTVDGKPERSWHRLKYVWKLEDE